MKKVSKMLVLLGLLACFSFGSASVALATVEKPIELHIGCDSPEDAVTFIFLTKFADLLEEKSGKRLVVRRYPNAQLGGDVALIEGVQNGDIGFAVQNTAPQVNFVPELALFDLPMIFPNQEVARKVMSGKLFEELQKAHAKKGITLYAYADQGFRELTSNRKVEKIEDLKGLKIRTMPNPNHILFWKSIGSNPTPMNFGELYIGLQQKVVDAQENPIETTVAAKLYEQQDYVVMTNHYIHGLSLIGSPDIVASLPADLQAIIPEAANEAKEYAYKMADERVAGRIKIIEDSGTKILEISPELYNQMRDMSAPVYAEVEKKVGKELVDLIKAEVEAAK
ncbi:TRAP transporter substrate-binding protein [Fusobacterium sp. PH5-44]|uniref:TRAP transporter substrate-binding protein n=1 Tax=unclassified Fusobacterium TaxID=2648384 RepID=UPI003D262BE4